MPSRLKRCQSVRAIAPPSPRTSACSTQGIAGCRQGLQVPGPAEVVTPTGTHPSVDYLQVGDRNASVYAPGQPPSLLRDGPRAPLARWGAADPERQQITRLQVWGVFSGEDSQTTG